MPQSRVWVSYPESQEFMPWKRKEELLDSEPTFPHITREKLRLRYLSRDHR